MIQVHKNALICKLPNRRTYIFKTTEAVTLQCHRLQEVTEEQLEIIEKSKTYNFIRVIKLKNKILVYSFANFGFTPEMFELISQTYFPLQQIDYYDKG